MTPEPKEGEDPLDRAGVERKAKAAANKIIINFLAWYQERQKEYQEVKK